MRVEAPLAEDAQILRAHPAGLPRARSTARVAGARASRRSTPTPSCRRARSTAARRAAGRGGARRRHGDGGRGAERLLRGAPARATTPRPRRRWASASSATSVIGARHALEAHGLERVAIVDFDVHHGNGTQDLVWDDARILFASTHQMPLYPGTGAARRARARTARSSTCRCRPGASGGVFRAGDARRGCCRRSRRIAPRDDPDLGRASTRTRATRWRTSSSPRPTSPGRRRGSATLADRLCGGRIVSTLEGGYDLSALAASVAAHVRVLMERGHG